MKVSAVILAAGKGERAGFDKNKMFVKTDVLTPLERSVSAFLREDISEIIVAVAPQDYSLAQELLKNIPHLTFVFGGETRTQSVKNSLSAVTGEIVLIHDGARPFVTQKIISDCIESVKKFGSGICSLPATDTFALASEEGELLSFPNRANLHSLQTPQGFFTKDILRAYESVGQQTFTDDSAVYRAFIGAPHLFEGDPCNKKLTYRSDFSFGGERVGFGVDTHAFGKQQNFITLCGVKIPSESGLVAHSDGDVAVHALMDALLSAAGLNDIGHYFPDTDEKYSGADSMLLLEEVLDLLKEKSLAPMNVSLAIQAERPRLKNYILAMKNSLARALSLSSDFIGISAGTSEGLGFVGEGKGICVSAVVLLKKL